MRYWMPTLAIAAIAGCPAGDAPDVRETDSDVSTTNPGPPPSATFGGPPSTYDEDPATSSGPDPRPEPTSTTGDEPAPGTTAGETTAAVEPPPEPPAWQPKPCPDIYAQDLLPTFELELAPHELQALQQEWEAGDDNNTPEHPVLKFRYEDEVITYASVRLRGNSTWWPGQKKMQFQVSFNKYDKKGRFRGLKKILFDAAEYNRSFLRDRLAMAIFRDVGVPAPCANNARLVVNGEYYGLFSNIEKVDSEFLERVFEFDEGNLYKRGGGWDKKTNEEDPDESDLEALLDADDIDELAAVMNLDEAVLEWAAEAVMPDNDGAWAGGLNFYLYNDPQTGFNIIPWDKDATFTRIAPDVDPYTYEKPNFKGRPQYVLVTDDPAWFERYIAAIERVLEAGYDVETLQERIDTWTAQIEQAAFDDVNKPFTDEQYLDAVEALREFVALRRDFVEGWLGCWRKGGKKGPSGECVP